MAKRSLELRATKSVIIKQSKGSGTSQDHNWRREYDGNDVVEK